MLYPPDALDPTVSDETRFLALTPDCDDAWFYWMARRAGWRFRKVGRARSVLCWPGTQDAGLQHRNKTGNDDAVRRLSAAFGQPWRADFVKPQTQPLRAGGLAPGSAAPGRARRASMRGRRTSFRG